mgnify:CR=1 FL=1
MEERELELDKVLENYEIYVLDLCEIRKFGEAIIGKSNGDIFSYIGETKGQRGV